MDVFILVDNNFEKTSMTKLILQSVNLLLLVFLMNTNSSAYSDFSHFQVDTSIISKENRISFLDHLQEIGEVVEVTLETDISLLVENKYSGNFQPATFEYKDANGDTLTFDIKVKPRGNLRRKLCDIPPMKLNFSKKDFKKKGIKKFDDFKLVTHCLSKTGKEAQRLVLREYMAYKLYNQLTPESFKVQLMKVKYIDTSGKYKTKIKYSFIIEDDKELANRINGKLLKVQGLIAKDFSPHIYQRVAMFNYMIGNTDWDTRKLHNVKLVQLNETKEIIIVPYDFDFSGMVNASYALPSPDFRIRHVRERHYRGWRYSNPVFPISQEMFLQKELDFYNELEQFTCFEKKCRVYTSNYLKSFYKRLKKKKLIKKHFQPDKIYVKK